MENIITTVYADGRQETRPMTEEEINQREIDIANAEERKKYEEEVFSARESALLSAKKKLKKIGLTDEEISAFRNELIEL